MSKFTSFDAFRRSTIGAAGKHVFMSDTNDDYIPDPSGLNVHGVTASDSVAVLRNTYDESYSAGCSIHTDWRTRANSRKLVVSRTIAKPHIIK